MKKSVYIFLLPIFLLSCTNKLVTQNISGAGDCSYCDRHWSWSNGVATVGDIEDEYYIQNSAYFPQFNFTTIVSGDLSFSYKINDDYLGEIQITGAGVNFHAEEEPMEWTSVKAGHVNKGKKILVNGRECSIKDIIIVGNAEENKPSSPEPEKPQYDF